MAAFGHGVRTRGVRGFKTRMSASYSRRHDYNIFAVHSEIDGILPKMAASMAYFTSVLGDDVGLIPVCGKQSK